MKFAKLFDTPHGQLLATMDEQEDDDSWPLTFRGEGNRNVSPSIIFYYETKEACQQVFDDIDQSIANNTAESLANSVASLFSTKEQTQ